MRQPVQLEAGELTCRERPDPGLEKSPEHDLSGDVKRPDQMTLGCPVKSGSRPCGAIELRFRAPRAQARPGRLTGRDTLAIARKSAAVDRASLEIAAARSPSVAP